MIKVLFLDPDLPNIESMKFIDLALEYDLNVVFRHELRFLIIEAEMGVSIRYYQTNIDTTYRLLIPNHTIIGSNSYYKNVYDSLDSVIDVLKEYIIKENNL